MTLKIEAAILMTNQEITMISKKTTHIIDDIYKKNGILYRETNHRVPCQISALYEYRTGISPKEAQMLCLTSMYEAVNKKIKNCHNYILANSENWMNKTRISEYYKIWKALEKNNKFNVSIGDKLCEISIEKNGKIKYLGILKICIDDVAEIYNLLRSSRGSTLISTDVVDIEREASNILDNGFDPGDIYPSKIILDMCCNINMVAYSLIGSFDDMESGVSIFGKENLIYSIAEWRVSPHHLHL